MQVEGTGQMTCGIFRLAPLRPGKIEPAIEHGKVVAGNLLLQCVESLWPYIYVAMIGANERLGRYDEAYKALEVSRNFEPHYLDYDKLLQDMKRRQSMKLF
jgi:hypothetical protein